MLEPICWNFLQTLERANGNNKSFDDFCPSQFWKQLFIHNFGRAFVCFEKWSCSSRRRRKHHRKCLVDVTYWTTTNRCIFADDHGRQLLRSSLQTVMASPGKSRSFEISLVVPWKKSNTNFLYHTKVRSTLVPLLTSRRLICFLTERVEVPSLLTFTILEDFLKRDFYFGLRLLPEGQHAK